MEIVKNIEQLKEVSKDFDFQNPPEDPSALAHLLLEEMNAHDGLGLSAIQLGIPLRVFAMRALPEAFVCFNPRIAMPSETKAKMDEGCLSFPNLILKVERPRDVRVRFAGPDGQIRSHTFTGLTARIFQHELDHLNGRLFFEGAHRLHLERALKKARNRGNDYIGLMKYAKRSG